MGIFVGPTINSAKYQALNQFQISNLDRNFLERQRRDDNISVEQFNGNFSRGWIPWGMLHDLTDVGEPAITLVNDQASGYSINGLYRGFGSSVTTVQGLRAAILSNNNNNQATQVNTLVTSYGW